MNGMILYYGHSACVRQSAARLNQTTGFDLCNLAMNPQLDFREVNPIILGSGVARGRLLIADWLARHWHELRAKKLVLYTVFEQDVPSQDLDKILHASLTPEMRLRIQVFSLTAPQPVQLTQVGWREHLQPVISRISELTHLQSRVTALRWAQSRGALRSV